LQNEKLHNLYASSNIIRVIKSSRMPWLSHVARMGEMRNVHNILIGKLEGKRSCGIPRRRREDNIRVDLREIWWAGVDWMQVSGQGPVAGPC